MIDPKTPKFSQMQAPKQIAKPLRAIERVGLRMQSRGTAYKEIKAELSKEMARTKASGMALDFVTGGKPRGSKLNKLQAMKLMGKAGRLNTNLKDGTAFRLNKAVHVYEAAAAANVPKEITKPDEHKESAVPEDESRMARAKAQHDKLEAKIHAERVAHLEEKNKNVTTSASRMGKTETRSSDNVTHIGKTKTEAVTSVSHLSPGQKPAVTSVSHIEKKAESGAVVPTGHHLPTRRASVLDLPEDEHQHLMPGQFGNEETSETKPEALPMQLD